MSQRKNNEIKRFNKLKHVEWINKCVKESYKKECGKFEFIKSQINEISEFEKKEIKIDPCFNYQKWLKNRTLVDNNDSTWLKFLYGF